jgi:hypothetical protein
MADTLHDLYNNGKLTSMTARGCLPDLGHDSLVRIVPRRGEIRGHFAQLRRADAEVATSADYVHIGHVLLDHGQRALHVLGPCIKSQQG